jgi:hypothetical protein
MRRPLAALIATALAAPVFGAEKVSLVEVSAPLSPVAPIKALEVAPTFLGDPVAAARVDALLSQMPLRETSDAFLARIAEVSAAAQPAKNSNARAKAAPSLPPPVIAGRRGSQAEPAAPGGARASMEQLEQVTGALGDARRDAGETLRGAMDGGSAGDAVAAAQETAPAETEMARRMRLSDQNTRDRWRAWTKGPNRSPAKFAKESRPDEIAGREVPLFVAGQHTRATAPAGSHLQVMSIGIPGMARANKTDGSYEDYVLRHDGGKSYSAFLPPDTRSFVFYSLQGTFGEAGTYSSHVIDRRARSSAVAKGTPWRAWIDRHLQPGSDYLEDRAVLFGFLVSLFRTDWKDTNVGNLPVFKSLPQGQSPDDAAVTAILRTLAERWEALELDDLHGSFDFMLVEAAMTHLQSPFSLWRNYKLIRSLERPRALTHVVKALALHLRAFPHEPELYGEPGAVKNGVVDAEILVDAVPNLVKDFIDNWQDVNSRNRPERPAERTYRLWIIAAALDGNIYHDEILSRTMNLQSDYRRRLLERLANLPAGKLKNLLREISTTKWAKFGLESPTLAKEAVATTNLNYATDWLDDPITPRELGSDPAMSGMRPRPAGYYLGFGGGL